MLLQDIRSESKFRPDETGHNRHRCYLGKSAIYLTGLLVMFSTGDPVASRKGKRYHDRHHKFGQYYDASPGAIALAAPWMSRST